MKFYVAACAVMLAASSLAQSSEVEITAEPSHHTVLKNDFVRVFHVEIPPHAATLLHRHRHDYFIVALADSEVNSEIVGKPAHTGSMKTGQTAFAEGGFAHVVRNLADTPFPNIDVEVLHPKTSYQWDQERGVNVLEGGTQEILFVKDGVRASETDLQPHAMIPKHKHLVPHLVIAVSDIDLESAVDGRPVKHIRLKAGEVAWVQAGLTHTVMNAGHQNARYVALEFPPIK
jgi:quercetin dioxygenase-like cupin family protein